MSLDASKNVLHKFLFNASLFRIVYIIDLFIGMLACFEEISLILKCIILPWGGIVFIHNFIISKKIQKINYYKILLVFLGFCLLTTLINYKWNLLPNLLFIYHFAICFFVFYGLYVESDKDIIKKEMLFIFNFIIFATTILSCVGFLILATKMQISVGVYWLGIYNNRFIGVYSNQNLIALSCCLAIIFSHMFISKNILGNTTPKKNIKVLYIGTIVVNLCSLILSDSNASFLFLIIYFTVFMFYSLFSNKTDFLIRDLVKKISILLIFCIILSYAAFSLRNVLQGDIASFINDIHQSQEPVHDNKNESDNIIIEEPYTEEPIAIGRDPLSGTYDVSSGRITLLKQSLIIFKNHPVLGIGRGNIVDFGNREINGGLRFSDFHNGYVTIAVSWGIVGFTLFALFALLLAIYMFKRLFEKPICRYSNIYACLFAIIVSYSVYSLFEKTLLSEITFMVVIFWLILGYSMTYIEIKNKFMKEE